MNKKTILFGTLVILVLGTLGIAYATLENPETESKERKTNVEKTISTLDETSDSNDENKDEIKNEKELIRYIHRMTHPVVKSNEKWYLDIEPSPENVEKALGEIENNNYDFFGKASDVSRILNSFMEGNYKEAHKLHNLMWDFEDGTIGKATGINKDGIKKMVEKYHK